jgi:hypothetical protein
MCRDYSIVTPSLAVSFRCGHIKGDDTPAVLARQGHSAPDRILHKQCVIEEDGESQETAPAVLRPKVKEVQKGRAALAPAACRWCSAPTAWHTISPGSPLWGCVQ